MSVSGPHSNAPSQSSLVTSSNAHTHSSVSPVQPHSTQASGRETGRRGSLSLIGSANAARVRLTQDFRSLVRSNSTSTVSRYEDRHGRHQRAASVQVQSSPAGARGRNPSPHAPLLPRSVERGTYSMDKPREESRNGRSFGARLVDFLSRSRSRSRTRKRRSRSMDDIIIPVAEMPLPLQPGSLGRRNPYSAFGDSANTSASTSASSSGSKPLTRSPSRPLSGATTATDTTVKGKGRAVNRAHQDVRTPTPEHRVHVQTEVLSKQRKGNIFSVSIQGPRRLSSREQAGRARGAASPIPADQPATGRSLWSGRFRSGSNSSTGAHSSKSTVGDPSSSKEASPPPVPPKPIASTSASVKVSRPTVIAPTSRPPRQDTVTTLNSPPPPYEHNQIQYTETESDDLAGRCSPLCGLPSPRLTPVSDKGKERERTRETIIRSRDAERAREADRVREAERQREDIRARERAREAERQRAREEREMSKERERARDLERRKEKERIRGTRERHTGDAARERERRRGKDKEVITQPRRVGSPIVREKERESRLAAAAVQVAAAPMEKVASGSGSNNSNSKRSKDSGSSAPKVKRTKHGSFDFERPVSGALNVRTALRGLGVGLGAHSPQTVERSLSKEGTSRSQGPSQQKSVLQPPSMGRSGNSKRPPLDIAATTLARQPTENTQSTNPQSATHSHFHYSDFDPVSPHSSHSGQSSSLGRNAGARTLRGVHPAFRFEPTVPPIPGSPASDERGAHGGSLSHHAEPSPLGRSSSMTKGRSLDLGLSLSWAPQRVREEAVLSYTQSGRQPATTSRLRSRWKTAIADEHGRLDVPTPGSASSVATAFREALGDAAYGTFKTYVHRFDAHAIPLEGPYGLISAASRLLDNAGTLDELGKKALLDRFIGVVRENQ